MPNDGKGGTGGGLNEAALANIDDDEDLGGAGGSSGGGTIAGSGDPSGGTLAGTGGTTGGVAGDMLGGETVLGARSGSLGAKDGAIAAEAAALGDASGSLADAAAAAEPGAERLSAGPTGAEAIHQGVGRGDAGSGTPGDKGDLGGVGLATNSGGAARPGGSGNA